MVDRSDLYTKVTDTIIAQLEAGCVPWVQPWKAGVSSGVTGALPFNLVSKRHYSGVNIPLLWIAGERFGSHAWLTYRQAQAAGGNVAKGEKGTMVVYADKFIPKANAAIGDNTAIYFLKSFTVFNVEQCEGLPEQPAKVAPTMPELHAAGDTVIRNTGAKIVTGGDKAYYRPDGDLIVMPTPEAYAPDTINWYRTAFHEIGHWTGAKHRLDRQFGSRFGGDVYAMEELVAELSAAFTCASLGIVPTVRHADYIGAWIQIMKADKRAVVQAASKASKATDFILGCNAVQQAA